MKIMDKNALEIRGGMRKKVPGKPNTRDLMGEWPSVGGKGQPARRRAQPGGGHPEGERGAGGHEQRGLELSQGIWAKSQGKGKRKVSVLGGMGY